MEAIKEALIAKSKGEVPIGCVVVKDQRIVSRAHNLKESLRLASAHAEVLAIEKASIYQNGWRLTGHVLYVTIEPCAMCAGLIYQSRVKRIVFGEYDLRGGACGGSFNVLASSQINHRVLLTPGVLSKECKSILTSFFSDKRSIRGVGADGPRYAP